MWSGEKLFRAGGFLGFGWLGIFRWFVLTSYSARHRAFLDAFVDVFSYRVSGIWFHCFFHILFH